MSVHVEYAAVMVPDNGRQGWWYGITAEQVELHLAQDKAMLTDIDAYIDGDNKLKFVVTTQPQTDAYWWYYGQTAAQVTKLLAQNKAVLKKVSPYIDTDNTLKFAVIMTAPQSTASWWWYFGLTGEEIAQHLAQNKAGLTGISAYVDTDATVKFAVIMAEGQKTWWYWGQSGADLEQHMSQNKAGLTDISAYVDPSDNTLKLAVIMAAGQKMWWYKGQSGADLQQHLTQNKANLVAASAYLIGSSDPITINVPSHLSGLDGNVTLTIQESGAYSFSGSWSPSNVLTGLVSQDINFVLTLRDVRGTAFVFSTSGTVSTEGTYRFDNHGTNRSLAEHWQFLQSAYTWRAECGANLDLGATFSAVVKWFKQNMQTIEQIVQVVGYIAGAAA